MTSKTKEVVYVTYTCKKCGTAFLDIDINNDINDLPLKTRYCPTCVSLGYTNGKTKKKLSIEQEREKIIKSKLKECGISDAQDVKFIQKYVKKQIKFKENTKQRIILNYIFNEAVEVLGYQAWKQN